MLLNIHLSITLMKSQLCMFGYSIDTYMSEIACMSKIV